MSKININMIRFLKKIRSHTIEKINGEIEDDRIILTDVIDVEIYMPKNRLIALDEVYLICIKKDTSMIKFHEKYSEKIIEVNLDNIKFITLR